MTTKVVVELLYGLGGAATSDGIVQLAQELKKIPNVHVSGPWDETNWQAAVADIKKWTVGETIVLIGYSMGANNITYVAEAIKPRPVALMVPIQPTLYAPADPVGSNVEHLVLVNNDGLIGIIETQGLGARDLEMSHDFKGVYRHMVIRDVHPYVDNDPVVHNLILTEVKKLAE